MDLSFRVNEAKSNAEREPTIKYVDLSTSSDASDVCDICNRRKLHVSTPASSCLEYLRLPPQVRHRNVSPVSSLR